MKTNINKLSAVGDPPQSERRQEMFNYGDNVKLSDSASLNTYLTLYYIDVSSKRLYALIKLKSVSQILIRNLTLYVNCFEGICFYHQMI